MHNMMEAATPLNQYKVRLRVNERVFFSSVEAQVSICFSSLRESPRVKLFLLEGFIDQFIYLLSSIFICIIFFKLFPDYFYVPGRVASRMLTVTQVR